MILRASAEIQVVNGALEISDPGETYCEARCDCGRGATVALSLLQHGLVTACGECEDHGEPIMINTHRLN